MTAGTGFSIPGPARPFAPPDVRATASRATATERLNACVLEAFRRLGEAEARVVVSEGRLLERLFTLRGHLGLGFAQFGDCVRETLGISPRHAADRRMLARLFRNRPNVERAFLEGRVTSCQALALRTVLTKDNETMWIELCSHLTVAELKERIRNDRNADRTSSPEDEEPFETISFMAPPAVAVAFDQALETTRRVLGVSAPRYRCLEAILAEAAGDAAPDGGSDSSPHGPDGDSGSRRPDKYASRRCDDSRTETTDASIPRFRARPCIRITLDLIDRELECFDDLIEADDSGDPATVVARLKALQTAARPLRYFAARLLSEIRDTGGLTLGEFAGRYLRVSERTAMNLVHEASLFENAILADAYGSGRIGIGQAVAIGRLAPAGRLDAWIERAEQLTHRQFQREAAIFERLQDYFPTLAARYPGPMPAPELDAVFVRELRLRGWTNEEIGDEIRRAGGANSTNSSDPAEDPVAMRRLEILLEMLIVTAFDTGVRFRGRAILERDRYLCQAPGCTRRRDLQVHHIRFRSQGGDNRPENRITLCFVHHQILLHEMGSLAVSGTAPCKLRWRVGASILSGERYESK